MANDNKIMIPETFPLRKYMLFAAVLLVGVAIGYSLHSLQKINTPRAVNLGADNPIITDKSARIRNAHILKIGKETLTVEDDAKHTATFPVSKDVFVSTPDADDASHDIQKVPVGSKASITLLVDKDHYVVESIIYYKK